MELKEIVNLRKLREEFYDEGADCRECPFRQHCFSRRDCLVRSVLGTGQADEDPYLARGAVPVDESLAEIW